LLVFRASYPVVSRRWLVLAGLGWSVGTALNFKIAAYTLTNDIV
jgi:hypothetical protein